MTEKDLGQGNAEGDHFLGSGEFPTDPQKRFDAVFAAIGNSEAKCVTLLCLSDMAATGIEIHARFKEVIGSAWETSDSLQAMYCNFSLRPMGLVDEVDVDGGNKRGYKLTQAGRQFRPIAAHILKEARKLEEPLVEIFGPTSSNNQLNRSVLTRPKVLALLMGTSETLTVLDIADALEMSPSSLSGNLRSLAALGFVEYSVVETEQRGMYRYHLVDGARRSDIHFEGKPAPSKELVNYVEDELFEQGENVELNAVTDAYTENHPKLLRNSVYTATAHIISSLSQQGIIEREGFRRPRDKSQVKITDKGRALVEDLIIPIKRALGGGVELLEEWRGIPWQDFSAELVLKHKSSSHANFRRVDETTRDTLAFIVSSPGIRAREISAAINRKATRFLAKLVDDKLVRKERVGNAVYYFPTGSSEIPGPTS